jgi:SAM-dependent methyltransferase
VKPATRPGGARQRFGGVRRSVRLFQGFRHQFDDEAEYYSFLADDTLALVEEQMPVAGTRVVDIGGGSGYFSRAFRRAGAESVLVEPSWEWMGVSGRGLGSGVVGDGRTLPLSDAAFDISFSSNVLEHVRDPEAFLDEMVRVVRPDGLVFLSFTNWLSPFGGHATAPWHYLGGEWSARRYERKHGRPPKNRYGTNLFALHIGDVLALVRARPDVDVIDAYPRYYPRWTRPLLKVPGLREVATWNLAIVLRRRAEATTHPGPVTLAPDAYRRTDQAIHGSSPLSIHV